MTIDVAVSDGVVFLVGYAMTPVLRVENRLVIDDQVVAAVGKTLARDSRPCGQDISFHFVHGIVTLSGETDNPGMRDSIAETAALSAGLFVFPRSCALAMWMVERDLEIVLHGSNSRGEFRILARLHQSRPDRSMWACQRLIWARFTSPVCSIPCKKSGQFR